MVSLLECSINGNDIELRPTAGSALAVLHDGARSVTEHTTCNYGLDLSATHVASTGGMSIAGVDDLDEVRAVERPDHRFFLGTLYQPQLNSTAAKPHPVFLGLVRAAIEAGAA